MNPTDKLIFVVEPDDEVALEIVAALATVGYEVIRIKNIHEAIVEMTESFPDLIILSYHAYAHRDIQSLSTATGKIPIIPTPDASWLLSVVGNAFIAADLTQ